MLALLFSFLLMAGCTGNAGSVSSAETKANIKVSSEESSEWNSTSPEDRQATISPEETASLPEETAQEPSEESLEESSFDEISQEPDLFVTEDGEYSTCDEVALYLHLYGHLPANYLTKKEARELGWDNSAGNLWDVAEGMSIGGDRFGNYEGLLPDEEDRVWRECDVGYEGGYRGAQRILYSSDGLIYYTEDHYQSFTCLYP